MPAADAAWLHMDRPTNIMVVNSVLWFDAPVDWARVRRIFLERVVDRFPRFSQRAVEGTLLAGPHWEDDPASIPTCTSTTWRCRRPTTARRSSASSPIA